MQGFPTIEVICPVCYVSNFSNPGKHNLLFNLIINFLLLHLTWEFLFIEQTLHRCYNCGLVMSSSSNLNYTREEHKSIEQSDV